MSLDKSFYMDEELGLDLKQPITKVDMTSIDLCLLSLEENMVMESEVDHTKGTTIQDPSAKVEIDSEAMLKDLQETIYSTLLNDMPDHCKMWSNDIDKHKKAQYHKATTLLICQRRKCGKSFRKQTFLKIHTKNNHTYTGIIAGRVKKMKQKYKRYRNV